MQHLSILLLLWIDMEGESWGRSSCKQRKCKDGLQPNNSRSTKDYLNVRMKKWNTNLFGSMIDIFLGENLLLLDQVHLPWCWPLSVAKEHSAIKGLLLEILTSVQSITNVRREKEASFPA